MNDLTTILDRCDVKWIDNEGNETIVKFAGYYNLTGTSLLVMLPSGARATLHTDSHKFAENLESYGISIPLEDKRALKERRRPILPRAKDRPAGTGSRRTDNEALQGEALPERPIVDAKGVVFDPVIHSAHPDGSPKRKLGKYFVEKKSAA